MFIQENGALTSKRRSRPEKRQRRRDTNIQYLRRISTLMIFILNTSTKSRTVSRQTSTCRAWFATKNPGSLTWTRRIEEQRLLDDLKSALGAGTTWSRIADLIELDNSQSKTTARTGPGTTDLTRFKEVLLRLKREGSSAPGAKGY